MNWDSYIANLKTSPVFKDPVLNLGDLIYFRFTRHLVIPATIVEVQEILWREGLEKAIWVNRRIDGTVECETDSGDVDSNGWPVYKPPDETILNGLLRVNQILWIDEPTGHEVDLGWDCFLTLDKALAHCQPTRRWHLRRRLKKWRNEMKRFIAGTHFNYFGTKAPKRFVKRVSFSKYPNKPVFCRR